MTKHEQIILGVFSFYEPMTFSNVILDLDKHLIGELGDFTREDLEATIKSLEKKKLIKDVVIDKETGWIRVHVRRSWWKRLFRL
jgi:hypothetical protein